MDAVTQMLDCNETITQFGVQDLVLGLKECETLTHSEQQLQGPKLTKRSQ